MLNLNEISSDLMNQFTLEIKFIKKNNRIEVDTTDPNCNFSNIEIFNRYISDQKSSYSIPFLVSYFASRVNSTKLQDSFRIYIYRLAKTWCTNLLDKSQNKSYQTEGQLKSLIESHALMYSSIPINYWESLELLNIQTFEFIES